jgi:ATP-dependent RNA helicase RhlE
MPQTLTESTFDTLGLPQPILNVIGRLGFTTPTPIQKEAIPHGMQGADVLGIAQTGTGKTLAFGLPMIAHIRERRGMGIVVVPTRELALQVDEILRKVGTSLQIKTAVLIGGAPMHRQIQQIRGGAHIIVATPGRLVDHLKQGTVRLDNICIAVLDEADRMLDMGFLPDIRRIMERMPKDRQTMLYSATMPKEIESLTHAFMTNPIRVEIDRAGTATELVEQSLLVVEMEDKPETLRRLITESDGTVLVFSRTRHGARKTASMVRQFGFSSAELHSDRTLAQRREALDGFKAGRYRVLVATDIAARGIDVKRIELVVNYDVPDNPDDYVHRIGRTGRAGETGRAITVATPQQGGLVRDVERVLGQEIPLSPDSPLRFEPRSAGRPSGGGGRGRSQRPPRPLSDSRPSFRQRPEPGSIPESVRPESAPRPERPIQPDGPRTPRPEERGPRSEKPRFAPGSSAHVKPAAAPHATTAPTGPRRPAPGVAGPPAKKRLPEGPHPFDKFMKSPKRHG